MSCTVGGIVLPDGPFMIGAGVCKSPESTKEWLKVAPVVSGSYTPESREGNSGKVFYPDTLEELRQIGFGLNCFGMPNIGFAQAAAELSSIRPEQPFVVSVAGFSVMDYIDGYDLFSRLQNVAAIELNFGCPNTQHGEIMSFMQADIGTVLSRIRSGNTPVWVKLSPYSNPSELKTIAQEINDHDYLVRAVVTMNTVPNAYAGQGTLQCEQTKNRGGMSGPKVKEFALGQVNQFREHLDRHIDVIGVGGIMSGDDAIDFIDAGATAVQMTSWPFWAGSPRRFMDELTASERFIDYVNRNY